MGFKFYKEPFDISQPPPSPPNREFDVLPIVGRIYTKESKQRGNEYMARLEEYGNNLRGSVVK
ncbi:MAG: hypothetical protein A2Y12_08755 [Planctomycetes bacterium GWF2_42_9]|nr:MAG: hypothetical protein A2Y12_08755 [Planctomycetes bacterium GWF2_42_9]HAL45487.1 hypothetical protein [Phycisphaerales bacterium]